MVGAVFKTVGRRPSASPVGSTPMCSRHHSRLRSYAREPVNLVNTQMNTATATAIATLVPATAP